MSTTTSVKLPEIPGELWMLWKIGTTDGDDFDPGWCVAYDDPPGGDNYLVCFSEADANVSAFVDPCAAGPIGSFSAKLKNG